MAVPDDEVPEAAAREAALDQKRLAVFEGEGRPEIRLIDGPLPGFARPARGRAEPIRLARGEIDRRAVASVVERKPTNEVLDPADASRERGVFARKERRLRAIGIDRLDLDRDRDPAIHGLLALEIMPGHDRACVRRERKPGLRPRPGRDARDERIASVAPDFELRVVQARDDTGRGIARIEVAAAFDGEGGVDGALRVAADVIGEARGDRGRLVDRVGVVAVEAAACRHRRPECGPQRIGFESEVEAAAEQMHQEPDAARDFGRIMDATFGRKMAPIDLGERLEQRVQRAATFGVLARSRDLVVVVAPVLVLVPAQASRSTRPVPPSMRMRSPVRRRRVPSDVLMTQGMPSSRATIAPWESGPPMSITTPPASKK